MKSFEYPLSGGITGHVFETGESVVVNDVLQDQRYRSIKGWQAGSEMCVAIREGKEFWESWMWRAVHAMPLPIMISLRWSPWQGFLPL